ncbi:D123-domain-containing protein [Chytriomyces sp. MP71]|nr:D123-domain-containing protein [Chytriomyces sp. MP71]
MSFPPLTRNHVLNCAFQSWYPHFKQVSLKSEIISLPAEFVHYLNEDGVFLPLDCNGLPQPSYETSKDEAEPEDADSDAGDAETEDEQHWAKNKIPSFPALQAKIEEKIASLGGSVFPKLNWSSPKDASWMALGQTLECKTPADIFLLLKSSDFVSHDLTCPFEGCEEMVEDGAEFWLQPLPATGYKLVLRKWYDLHPSMEFRCFAKDGVLVGISQRDYLNHYPFLANTRLTIEAAIHDFYKNEIHGKFENSSYVFDAYMNRNTRKLYLIDFNPFSATTDSLLFDWDEILSFDTTKNEVGLGLRVVASAGEAGQLQQPMYATNRMPKDAIDISDGQTLAEFAQQWAEQMAQSLVE